MRTAFIKTLEEEAARDERICLVVGDLGFGVVMDFAERFPRQFINPGVAEQNMTGIATGLALSGRTVFTYSIANFPTIRPFEQIRNDICYHNANVKIVAVGGGFCYGALGPTHFATEDLATMRALPNMIVVAPGDPWEARAATKALIQHDGPGYLRLGRAGEPAVHSADVPFTVGKATTVRSGDDVALLVIGGLLSNATKAADVLAEQGIGARVISMRTLKPLDAETVCRAAKETGAVLTVEEHSIIGGLGGAVAEVLGESAINARFKRLGVPSEFSDRVGTQDWFLRKYRLDVEGIANSVLELLA